MQSVESTISSVSLDCYDLVVNDASLPSDHFPSYPRFVFSQTGSLICSFSANQLNCHFPNGKIFLWTPSEASSFITLLKNWPTDAPRSWTIADVTFLNNSQILLLLAPPESGKPLRSIICLIDLNDGTAVSFQRFISLRGKAEMIHVVSTDHNTLPGFHGAVVVALERGQTALLDLCLDWNIPNRTYLETSACISVEQCVKSIAEGELISPLSPKMEHSLVNLNASRISLNNFYYQTPRDETVGKFPSVSVNVTLLQYVPQIRALVVGFSFGGWQLWSLTKLKVLFTFRDLPPVSVPVVACAFTEPSDDPRYYCYLWIGWQSIRNHSTSNSDSTTSASGTANPKVGLFQLGFRERTEHTQPETEDTLYEYNDFYGATRRLSTVLAPITTSFTHETPHWKAQGPLLTSIQSLGTNYTPNFGLRSNRLTAIVWRAAPHIIRIGLFDLDRWYHAQMPAGIRSDNSFFAVYDAFLDKPRAHPLTAYVLPHTLFAFWANVYRMELSAFKICGEVSAAQSPLRGYQDLRKPLPECQLRPSTHAFKALVPFITDYSVAFATQTFISRQESALREISSAISSIPTSNPTIFDPTEWITEAAACGLLQEFEDSDIDILQALKEVEGSDWILRLAIGLENPSQELLKQIELIDSEEDGEVDSFESIFPTSPQNDRRKRRMLSLHDTERELKRPRRVVEQGTTRGAKYLPPVWVIIVNCLLEHGMYEEIKKLDGLISSQEELDFNPKVFMRRWLWLKWLGKKHSLEQLLTPIFDSDKEAKSKLTFENVIKELCLCFESLRVLADIAKVVMSPLFISDDDLENSAAVSAEAKLKLIQSLAEYTRPVSLLIRLGVLPYGVDFKPKSCVLSPYNYEEISALITKLQTIQKTPSSRPPFITDCLLDHLKSILNASDQIDSVSLNALTSSYPPRHLQSICALWQYVDTSTASPNLPTHLALLSFILFDAVTITALHEDTNQAEEENGDEIEQNPPIHIVGRLRLVEVDKNAAQLAPSPAVSKLGPVARAVKLQQYVVNQIVNEFPHFGKFIFTVRTLWLLDRFRFSDVLCSRLSLLATGQVTDLGHLPEVFPNQSRLIAEHCIRYGQTELAARFDPHSTSNQTAGCVIPGLYQARQLYSRKSDRQEAAKILIEAANSFEKKGQFLDFISPGLSQWEAAVLFTDLRDRGEKRLLLAALIARAQYKEAQDVLTELDSSGGRKMSVDSTVRSLISTISACLPQLKFLSAFSHLRPRLRESSLLTGPLSVPGSVTGSSVLSRNRYRQTLYVEEGEDGDFAASRSYLAKQFATPKGKRLPVQPSDEDRMRATEFWNQFNVTQRVLRGEKPFETPRSPVKPNITDSARRLRRKLNQMLYSSSVMSPFPQKSKKMSSLFASVRESKASAASGIAPGHRGSDFWSELGEMSRMSTLSTSVCAVSAGRNSSTQSTISILKVRSVPKEAVPETVPSDDDDDMSPPTLPPQKIGKKRTLLPMEEEEKTDEPSSSSFADLDISTSDYSKEDGGDGESYQLGISSDDAEITINASTLHLSHKISLAESTLDDTKSTDEGLLSTRMYSFSPPIRTVNPADARPSGMDEVADALCSARHFVFASPATFLARKFVPPATTFLSSMVEEEENENFDFSASTTTEGFTFDNATEEDVEEHGNEHSTDVALTIDDDDVSTSPGTEDEVKPVELLTPRRSKRKIKVPERFKY